MKKTWHSLKNRVTAMLLALICVLGLLPTAALAAGADTIKLERFGMSGVSYQSASLGRCTMHQITAWPERPPWASAGRRAAAWAPL